MDFWAPEKRCRIHGDVEVEEPPNASKIKRPLIMPLE
jgi:hypothetical protein